VTGQEAMDTNRNKGNSTSTYIRRAIVSSKDGQTLAQVAQRNCGVSLLGDIQNLTGQHPEQPDLGIPSLNRG